MYIKITLMWGEYSEMHNAAVLRYKVNPCTSSY